MVASGRSDDPIRPVRIEGSLLPVDKCQHPWPRVALIEVGSRIGLQCADCGIMLKVNGQLLLFEIK